MGQEIDLLINYPKSKRNLDARANEKKNQIERLLESLVESFLMVRGNMDMADLLILQDFGNLSFRPLRITGI